MNTLNDASLAIQQGRTKAALKLLLDTVNNKFSDHTELRNATITIYARFNQLQKKRITGQLGDGEAQISENQILYRLTELVEILKEEQNGREAEKSPATVEFKPKSRILFFAANPVGMGQLSLGKEVKEIEASLARAKLSDRFEFISAFATQPNDFLKRILEVRPEFVHFSGHGTKSGIYMLDEDDDPLLMPAKQLSEIFRLFREVVGCVLLNACYSAAQAERIKEYIPNVIGTTHAVGDDSAIQFASLFYTAIGEGYEIPFAYEFARLGLDMNELEGDMFVMN